MPNKLEETNQGPQQLARFYYGWWLVSSAIVVNGLLGGLNYSALPVYFLPLAREFDITYTRVSVIFSLRSLLDVVGAPLGGFLVDKLGPRFMIAGGVILGGVGFILLAFTKSYLQFVVVLMSLVSLGFSAPDHGVSAGINMWFRRRLGIAISIASTGLAIGGFALTPFIAWLVLGFSWRWAAAISGILMLTIGLPLAVVYRKPRPTETKDEDFGGTNPTGKECPMNETSNGGRPSPIAPNLDFTIREAMHTPTYWLLGAALALRLSAQITLMVHIVPILVSKDISEGFAAGLISLVAFARLPTSIIAGFISDKWSRQRISAIANFIGAIACVTILLGPSGLPTGVVFALFFGFAHAANAITWALVGQFYGRNNFGLLRGSVSLIPGLASAVGPVLAGWSFDYIGDYTATLAVVGFIYFLAAIIFWNLQPPQRSTHVS